MNRINFYKISAMRTSVCSLGELLQRQCHPASPSQLYRDVITCLVFTPQTVDNDIINAAFEKVILDHFSWQT